MGHTSPTTMRPATVAAFLLLAYVYCASAGRIFILDDGEDGLVHRVRRDALPYGPPAPAPYQPAPHYGPKDPRVGPVYTFVKTDPQANQPKWGVRHKAGAQYGK